METKSGAHSQPRDRTSFLPRLSHSEQSRFNPDFMAYLENGPSGSAEAGLSPLIVQVVVW